VVVRPCTSHQGRHGLTGDAVNTAARLLQQAERLLDGAEAHNRLVGPPEAMRLRLAQGRHGEALRLADRLEDDARAEPTLRSRHHVAAARALARTAQAGTDDATIGALRRRHDQALAARWLHGAAELQQAPASVTARR
jgi:hypothetical protein